MTSLLPTRPDGGYDWKEIQRILIDQEGLSPALAFRVAEFAALVGRHTRERTLTIAERVARMDSTKHGEIGVGMCIAAAAIKAAINNMEV